MLEQLPSPLGERHVAGEFSVNWQHLLPRERLWHGRCPRTGSARAGPAKWQASTGLCVVSRRDRSDGAIREQLRDLVGWERLPLRVPQRCNQRWSMDFVSDSLCSGRHFQALNIVDDHTRECPGQLLTCRSPGNRQSASSINLPCTAFEEIVLDNGPELTSKAMFLWPPQLIPVITKASTAATTRAPTL